MDNDFIDRLRKLVDEQGARSSTAKAVWMNKIFTAWRTENAVKTSKSARDLSRAVRPE
jgi:hypothetical protein